MQESVSVGQREEEKKGERLGERKILGEVVSINELEMANIGL